MMEHQPRERAVPCRGWHNMRDRVMTLNYSALCDRCERLELRERDDDARDAMDAAMAVRDELARDRHLYDCTQVDR